jgi:hypothetical protein
VTVLGILLPFVAIGVGLLIPRSATSGLLIPASFAVSGALIGRWWAFLPSLAVAVALNLAELAGVRHEGAAIELHGPGSFDLGFLLLSSSVAITFAVVGAAASAAVSTALRRRGLAGGY